MALDFPHDFGTSTSSGGNVSDKNLHTLIKATKKSDVLTDVAGKAFVEFQKAKVGVCQQVTKWAASSAAFFGTALASVAAAGGATYWTLRTPIHEAVKACTNESITLETVGECAKSFVGPFVNNESFISEGLPLVGGYASWLTPLKISGVVAALAAVDASVGNRIGFKPIRGCVRLGQTMVKSWFVYTSYKAGEITTKYFERQEAEKDGIRKRTHLVISEQEVKTFDALAERLMQRLQQVDDHPKTLASLKRDVERLHAKMPWIRQALASHSLDPSEVQKIMDKLGVAIQAIKSMKLELRVPVSDKDTQHNVEFLLTANESDIQTHGLAIPTVVRKELQLAEEATLGKMHTVKSISGAGAKATLAALIVGTVVPAVAAAGAYGAKVYGSPTAWDEGMTCYSALNQTVTSSNATVLSRETLTSAYNQALAPESACSGAAGVLGAAAALAFIAAAWKGFSVLSQAKKERKEADQARDSHYEKALSDLNTIYSQMLVYLEKRPQEKTALAKKLPVIRKQTERVFGKDAWAAGQLQEALNATQTR